MTKLDDIHAMLADSEDMLTFEGTPHPCFLIQHDNSVAQTAPGAGKLQRDTFVQTAVDYLAGIKTGAPMQLNGVAWRAMRVELIQDGLMYQVWLGAANG